MSEIMQEYGHGDCRFAGGMLGRPPHVQGPEVAPVLPAACCSYINEKNPKP